MANEKHGEETTPKAPHGAAHTEPAKGRIPETEETESEDPTANFSEAQKEAYNKHTTIKWEDAGAKKNAALITDYVFGINPEKFEKHAKNASKEETKEILTIAKQLGFDDVVTAEKLSDL